VAGPEQERVAAWRVMGWVRQMNMAEGSETARLSPSLILDGVARDTQPLYGEVLACYDVCCCG
jgi:hypothetical protein